MIHPEHLQSMCMRMFCGDQKVWCESLGAADGGGLTAEENQGTPVRSFPKCFACLCSFDRRRLYS